MYTDTIHLFRKCVIQPLIPWFKFSLNSSNKPEALDSHGHFQCLNPVYTTFLKALLKWETLTEVSVRPV